MLLFRWSVCALLVCALAVGLCHPAAAELAVGTRALGMGGAFTAIADDMTAPYYNPAGLANIGRASFQLPQAQLRVDTNLDWRDVMKNPPTSDAKRLELLRELSSGKSSVSLSASTGFGLPGFAVTLVPQVRAELDASGLLLDASGDPTAGSSAGINVVGAAAANISYARKMKNGGAYGITVKPMKSWKVSQVLSYDLSEGSVVETSTKSPTVEKSGVGVDVGYLGEVSPGTSVGVMVRNLIEPSVDGTFAERQVNMGIAHRMANGNVTLAADVVRVFDNPVLNLGAEVKAGKTLRLWGGIYQRKPTIGVGLNIFGIRTNLAYSPENTSIVSGGFRFY